MAWAYLVAAGLLEIGFTTALRYVEGFTRLGPTLIFIALGAASFFLLTKSLDGIPLGTAYAVWTGIGAAGTVIIGMLYYQEPATTLRTLLLMLLVGSIIGLKLVSPHA